MIYLDNNATTFLDPIVIESMHSILMGNYGNPSSIHRFGQAAKALLNKASRQVASYFQVTSQEVIFTSSATEGLNMLIASVPKGGHIITSSLEHAAVLEPLKRSGSPITYIDPHFGQGAVSAEQVIESLKPNTAMIVLMAANNETGIKTDLSSIAKIAKERDIPFIVDGVALLGKEPLMLPEGVSAACFSGHKIHGPSGSGCVILRKTYRPKSLIVGGGQQNGLRGGTENLAAIIGFAKAVERCAELMSTAVQQITILRDRFENILTSHLGNAIIHGINQPRVCNTSNISFPEIDGETLLMLLDLEGVAASHGSACSSGALEPSRVLLGMGIKPSIARASIRFSLSRYTTEEEIDNAASLIIAIVKKIQKI